MPECQECDSFVSAAWARVFGDPETGEVNGCLSCDRKGQHGGVAR